MIKNPVLRAIHFLNSSISSVITLWKILFAIEDNDQLTNLLLDSLGRKTLVELTLIYMEKDASIDLCYLSCLEMGYPT